MRIIEGFRVRTIAGEHYILGEGLKQIGFKKTVTLNDAALWLWKQLEGKEFTTDTVAGLILANYPFSKEEAMEYAQDTIRAWSEIPVIEE